MRQNDVRELAVRRVTLIAAYLLAAAACVAAILSLVIDRRFTLWLVNGALLAYLLVVRPLDRQYNLAFARANLARGCGNSLQQVQVLRKGPLTREQLQAAALLPTRREGSGVVCGLTLQARHGEMEVTACELTSSYDLAGGGRRRAGLLNGVWLEVRLPRDTGRQMVLAKRGILDDSVCPAFYEAQGLAAQPVLEGALQQDYLLFDRDPGGRDANRFARQSLPLVERAAREGAGVLLALHGDSLCAFLDRRALTFTTPVLEPVTEELLAWDRLPELHLLLELADYWQKHGAAR